MSTLSFLVEKARREKGLSYEKVSREVSISLNQLRNVLESGFTNGTQLGTVRGFAKFLGMQPWQLLKILEEEGGQDSP